MDLVLRSRPGGGPASAIGVRRLIGTVILCTLLGLGGAPLSVRAQGSGVAGFDLSCPASVSEGARLTCSLTNSGGSLAAWPVVAILHLSSDANRALVRGSPLDLAFGTQAPVAAVEGGVWWHGDVLVGYSRFDWTGSAAAGASRSVSIMVEDDGDYEEQEVFYVSLAGVAPVSWTVYV